MTTTGSTTTEATTATTERTAALGLPTSASPEPAAATGTSRWWARLGGRAARTRILAWVLLLVGAALATVTLVTWALLVQATDESMRTALRAEVEEFTALTSSGINPATGAPFDGVEAVLQSAITYNLARPNEKFLGYVNGTFRFQSRQQAPVLLADDARFTALVGSVTSPVTGSYDSAAGEVFYLAVPVTVTGDPARGVIVVAYFADQERRAADEAAALMAGVGAVAVLAATAAAWGIAGRILRPVRDVADTARTITDRDLSGRIPIAPSTSPHDEVGQLVHTVNAMLDRIEGGVAAQRRFVDDAGHELRTPITIVRGHLDVVDTDDPVDVAATLELVDEELERMNRMVSDLLMLARAEQPRFIRPQPTDIDALLDDVLTKARSLGDREWGQPPDPGLGVVPLDAQRVTQALLALADNATHHTGPGDRIAIGGAVDDGALRLRVSDTGRGVPVSERDRIFSRFVRGTEAPRSEGAGLGLAIVSAIATAHRGRVEVGDGIGSGRTGETGPGASFTLVLPIQGARTEPR